MEGDGLDDRDQSADDVGFDAAELMRDPEFQPGSRLNYTLLKSHSTRPLAWTALFFAYAEFTGPLLVLFWLVSGLGIPDQIGIALGISYLALPFGVGVLAALARRGTDGMHLAKHATRIVVPAPISLAICAFPFGWTTFLAAIIACVFLMFINLLLVVAADVVVN